MTKKPSELIFISRIKRDGSGTSRVLKKELHQLNNAPYIDRTYIINPLSLSEGTYIASGFNSYVVKLK